MGIPHLRLPFRIGPTGAAEVVEQDSYEEIAQCVEVLLTTRQGDRLAVADYGVPDQVFLNENEVSAASLASLVQKWEPRAVVALGSAPVTGDELARVLGAKVRVAAGA